MYGNRLDSTLLCNIGGTNIAYGYLGADGAIRPRWEKTKKFRNFKQLLECLHESPSPLVGAGFSVAGLVEGGIAKVTNHPLIVSKSVAEDVLGVEIVMIENDMTAVAWSIDSLPAENLFDLIATTPTGCFLNRTIIAPGTGFGMAGFVESAGRQFSIASEGGHGTLPAETHFQRELYGILRKNGFLTIEDVVSGPGIENLHYAISIMYGHSHIKISAKEIFKMALSSSDEVCKATFDTYFDFLAIAARNIALTYCSFGGVYISGGIVQRYVHVMDKNRFSDVFVGEGRFSEQLRTTPVKVVMHRFPELLGLKRMLRR